MVSVGQLKSGFTVVCLSVSSILVAGSSTATNFAEDKISKCVEALKVPETKRIYINTAGEKLLSQLEEIETTLKNEKEPDKIKQLEIKKNDVLDQIDAKLAKKCRSFAFLQD